MGRTMTREVEWGIGLSFVVGMLILLVLAIGQFEGPTTVIMLVLAGVFLLIGFFFLSGTEEENPRPPRGPGADTASRATTLKPVPRPAETARACKNCGARASGPNPTCAQCGSPF